MANLITRPAREADRAVVEGIAVDALETLHDSPSVSQWGSGMRRGFIEHWFPAMGSTDIRAMVVAELDGVVVGAGSSRGSRRHPHAFLRLAVRHELRTRGIGSALLEAIMDEDAGPFTVREMLSDPATIAFYEERGFVTGERTMEGRIDPSQEPIASWIDDVLDRRTRVDYRRKANLDAAAALDELYLWTHPWSPPRPLDVDEAVDKYLRSARNDGVFTANRGGAVAGAALVTDSPFGAPRNVAHLALCGVVDPDVRQADEITSRLLAEVLAAARQRGWTVELEANDPNTYLWEAASQLPGVSLFSDMTLLVSSYGAPE